MDGQFYASELVSAAPLALLETGHLRRRSGPRVRRTTHHAAVWPGASGPHPRVKASTHNSLQDPFQFQVSVLLLALTEVSYLTAPMTSDLDLLSDSQGQNPSSGYSTGPKN